MKKRSLKKAGAVCLGVMTMLFGFAGCGGEGKGQGGNTEIVLNEVAHSIFYAPMYVAIEKGYFEEEGIDLTLVTGFGADKTMTAVLTGEADIGFMGSESTVYTYAGGTEDYVVNFAQLTQRAGNFLVSREPIDDFSWSMLIGKDVLGGRAGGMPEMVFEYILEKNGIDPADVTKASISAQRPRLFPAARANLQWSLSPMPPLWNRREKGMWWRPWGKIPALCLIPPFPQRKAFWRKTGSWFRPLPTPFRKGWIMCSPTARKK